MPPDYHPIHYPRDERIHTRTICYYNLLNNSISHKPTPTHTDGEATNPGPRLTKRGHRSQTAIIDRQLRNSTLALMEDTRALLARQKTEWASEKPTKSVLAEDRANINRDMSFMEATDGRADAKEVQIAEKKIGSSTKSDAQQEIIVGEPPRKITQDDISGRESHLNEERHSGLAWANLS